MTHKYKMPFYVMTVIAIIAVVAAIYLMTAGENTNTETESVALASVNDEEITKDQVYDVMYEQPVGGEEVFGKQVLESLIDEKIVNQKAEELEIEITDEEIDAAVQTEIDNLIEQYGSEDTLNQMLAQNGMSLDALKNDMRESMPMRLKAKKILGDELNPSEEDISKNFEENFANSIRASHILVETREEAEDLLAQLKDGADFAELAKEHSTDGSAASGGDLQYFTEDKMVPEFSEVAFSLEEGEISDVVESEFGFHIIKVTDKPTLEEQTEMITSTLIDQNLQGRYKSWLEELRAEADISYN